ncbi:hypothetical protein T07_604 [Trichinella nelsoni]|uniref:Uncharacterized protein n=1 Tax=Trichinella nelsoni TaxID=6336 RepID=A0A0V0SIP2_9BILA|nr:hypothetical protein T07_604 [Trichinella nelsoni]
MYHLITELKIRLWLSHIKTLKWKSSDTFSSKYPYIHIFNSKVSHKGAKMNLFCQTEAAQLDVSRDSDLQLIVVLVFIKNQNLLAWSNCSSAIILTKLHVKAKRVE